MTDTMQVLQYITTGSTTLLLGLAWKAAAAWKGTQKDIEYIKEQTTKTNGRVTLHGRQIDNHASRISTIEGRHTAVDARRKE